MATITRIEAVLSSVPDAVRENADQTNGDKCLNNDGKTMLLFDFYGTGDTSFTDKVTITLNSVSQCNQGHDHDIEVDMDRLDKKFVGPFEPTRWNDNDGMISWSYEAANTANNSKISTNVGVYAVKV